ncbi:hypothetical protein G6N74_26970 [Mesorhizobium sp. CGMCC 1.15528]|uniref:Uncharacterized protein n=1 Tax=Mesorhizobium zhangyense TaxID=1776730 RepID=A0A7C9VAM7_9HYPH|nr:hypothetical protein [Mesorhizobium zhangyense]NGN44704.1 hypothetical protein [Mesorhizobium zhangyense]
MTAPKSATDGEAMSELERAADQAIDACGGDARAAVTALLIANDFLERQLALTRIAVSSGFSRGWHHRKEHEQQTQQLHPERQRDRP